MAQSASAKKQIIESIGEATNILVAVNKNPSVDELSAALGLTIFLNKLGKHATAVFSGAVPPAIEFLKPDKTFEATTDSLRDFIIALDKEKADHLRYKVVDDAVVKIFITPYKTTITEADLEFSHGDYNVDLVIALNVAKNDDLDEALAAHGKILHDAKVVTVTSGEVKSSLGTADWRESSASGVSEMAAELASELKTAKAVLDEQISTAFLTGIVASTDRFSNNLTSSRVMSIAAELMASGANQQLIAIKLAESKELPAVVDQPEASDKELTENDQSDDSLKIDRTDGGKENSENGGENGDNIGVMHVSHVPRGDLDEVTRDTTEDARVSAAQVAEKLAQQSESEQRPGAISDTIGNMGQPALGGVLNATTEQAAEDKRREIEADRNRVILKHSSPSTSPTASLPPVAPPPLNAAMSGDKDEPEVVDIFAVPPSTAPTLSDDDALAASLNDAATAMAQDQQAAALAAVNDAMSSTPSRPKAANMPAAPTLAEIEAESRKATEGAAAAPFAPPAPSLPPMPDFSSLPPLPPAPIGVDTEALSPLPTTETTSADFNPSQFQIPGQK